MAPVILVPTLRSGLAQHHLFPVPLNRILALKEATRLQSLDPENWKRPLLTWGNRSREGWCLAWTLEWQHQGWAFFLWLLSPASSSRGAQSGA